MLKDTKYAASSCFTMFDDGVTKLGVEFFLVWLYIYYDVRGVMEVLDRLTIQ